MTISAGAAGDYLIESASGVTIRVAAMGEGEPLVLVHGTTANADGWASVAELDCRMESACETCSYFQTTIEFRPTLTRQRDHARDHGQHDRAALFDQLLDKVDRDDP